MDGGEPQQQFYTRVRGRVQGPFTVERLRLLAKRGRFGRHHHVSTDGVSWRPAAEFPELFPKTPPEKRKQRKQQLEPQFIEPVAEESTAAGDDTYDLEPSDAGSGTKTLWYYTQDMQECGPVSFSELQQLAVSGRLTPEDLVWSEGMPDWALASTIPELLPSPAGAEQFALAAQPEPERAEPSGPVSGESATPGVAPFAVACIALGLVGLLCPLGGIVAAVLGAWMTMAMLLIAALLFAILAVVFGHTALMQIRSSDGVLMGTGMATSGLVMGYLVLVALIVVGLVLLILVLLGVSIASNAANAVN